jgi:hypothetical protein
MYYVYFASSWLNEAVSNTEYTASTAWTTVNNHLGRMCKEYGVACFVAQQMHLLGRIEENQEYLRIRAVSVEIQTRHHNKLRSLNKIVPANLRLLWETDRK